MVIGERLFDSNDLILLIIFEPTQLNKGRGSAAKRETHYLHYPFQRHILYNSRRDGNGCHRRKKQTCHIVQNLSKSNKTGRRIVNTIF